MTGYIAANCEHVGLPFSSLMQTMSLNLAMISVSARTSSSFTVASSVEDPELGIFHFKCNMTFDNQRTCDNHDEHCFLGLGLGYSLLHTSVEEFHLCANILHFLKAMKFTFNRFID